MVFVGTAYFSRFVPQLKEFQPHSTSPTWIKLFINSWINYQTEEFEGMA